MASTATPSRTNLRRPASRVIVQLERRYRRPCEGTKVQRKRRDVPGRLMLLHSCAENEGTLHWVGMGWKAVRRRARCYTCCSDERDCWLRPLSTVKIVNNDSSVNIVGGREVGPSICMFPIRLCTVHAKLELAVLRRSKPSGNKLRSAYDAHT